MIDINARQLPFDVRSSLLLVCIISTLRHFNDTCYDWVVMAVAVKHAHSEAEAVSDKTASSSRPLTEKQTDRSHGSHSHLFSS